jgi:hypothetical protein
VLRAGSGWVSAVLSVGSEEIGFEGGVRDCGPLVILDWVGARDRGKQGVSG